LSKRYIALLLILLWLPNLANASSKTSSRKKRTARVVVSHHRGRHQARARKAGAWKRHGQQAIDEDRCRAIQQALIREHYLTGEADGVWNAETKAAMARFQKDNGWQSKRVPDSRALIKLGLGPTHEAVPATELAGSSLTRSSSLSQGATAPQR